MRRILPVLLTAVGIALPAAAQAAQPPLHAIASSYDPFTSLGGASGYYDATPSEMRIATPARPRGRAVTLPTGCSGRGVSLPDRLVFCETGPSFRIFNTGTAALTPVDTSPCGDRDLLDFGGLGRYWIAGREQNGSEHGEVQHTPIYLNRTTGECRHFTSGPRDVEKPDLPPVHRR